MMPQTTVNNAKGVPPLSSAIPKSIPNHFLGFVLALLVVATGKVVNAEDALADFETLTAQCPNALFDEWNGEQCQENVHFISKGADEDYFELEDVTADPKFAEVINKVQYPDPLVHNYPGEVSYSLPPDRDDIVYATIEEQMYRYSANSFLIYQNGQLIYEKYAKKGDQAFPDYLTGGQNKIRANDFTQNDRHSLFSVTKSFMGMVFAKLLVEVNGFNEDDLVTRQVPGLENTSAFNTATVRMIADMSVEFQYDESIFPGLSLDQILEGNAARTEFILNGEEGDYPLPKGFEYNTWVQLTGITQFIEPDEPLWYSTGNPPVLSDVGITGRDWVDAMPPKLEFIKLLQRGNTTLENGVVFTYRSVLTDLLAVICSAVIQDAYPGEYDSVEDYFEKEIWVKLGTDQDLSLVVNDDEVPNWWSMGSATARDLLRTGIMLLNDGKNHKGEQVLPKDAVDDIFDGSDLSRSQFVDSNFGGPIRQSGVVYNSSAFPDLKTCEQMTTDWSYRNNMYTYNPKQGKGTGEIAQFEGFHGQNVYVDRKADLVVVQLSMDLNYDTVTPENMVHFGLQPSFHALSVYFRCNPTTGNINEETTSGVLDPSNVAIEDVTVESSDGGLLSVRMHPLALLCIVGFLLA